MGGERDQRMGAPSHSNPNPVKGECLAHAFAFAGSTCAGADGRGYNLRGDDERPYQRP
jgi:hypothetical protein